MTKKSRPSSTKHRTKTSSGGAQPRPTPTSRIPKRDPCPVRRPAADGIPPPADDLNTASVPATLPLEVWAGLLPLLRGLQRAVDGGPTQADSPPEADGGRGDADEPRQEEPNEGNDDHAGAMPMSPEGGDR